MKEYTPMLAQTADKPFSSKDWIFELKWDGIRAISYIDGVLSIKSRNQIDLLRNFPELNELKTLTRKTVLDGEIIVMKKGVPDFQIFLERNQPSSAVDIDYMAKKHPATYVVFDILEKNNKSLTNKPLMKRKQILLDSVEEGNFVVLSNFVEEKGIEFYRAVLEKGVEGVVAKKKSSTYTPGKRSREWLKIKEIRTCDCVIFGYTTGKGGRKTGFGALVLGLYENKKPVYVGKVGTGFSQRDIEELKKAFTGLERKTKPIENIEIKDPVTWLEPELVVEIGFQTVTRDGKLRIPRYLGLRPDKSPASCTIDQIKREALKDYRAKRDFTKTSEPKGKPAEGFGRIFVVHEHHARRLHYDLRLERDGALKSWAVPKGLPLKPGEKRLAVETEDHPLEYADFQGIIPKGEYGAGKVVIWDSGLYEPLHWQSDKIEFLVKGKRLDGRYVIVRLKKAGEKDWLILKAGGV